MSNPHEALARLRKANRLADAIVELEIFAPGDVETLPVEARRSIEVFAEVNPASDTTWILVPEILRGRTQYAQVASTMVDPFDGLS